MNRRSTTPSIAVVLTGVLMTLTANSSAQQWSHTGPLPRLGSSAVLDIGSNKTILFGGTASQLNDAGRNLADVWWLSNTGGSGLIWTTTSIGGSRPAPRNGHSAVYDPGSNRMIIFGGGLGYASPCSNDVWALSNANDTSGAPAWTRLNPSGTPPPPRLRHAAVYDTTTNTMIIYGGNDCFSARYGDVWILTHANGLDGTPTWTQLSPIGSAPPGRQSASAVYDPASNRMIIYGGEEGLPSLDGNVWVLTNANGTGGTPGWIELSISGTIPPARELQSAVYDSVNNIMTVFGGLNESGQSLNDLWTLSGANGIGVSEWTALNPALTLGPVPTYEHNAVYNPSSNKMTVLGGIGTVFTIQGTPADVVLEDVWTVNHANGQ